MVLYRYLAERNPDGAYIDGVPLADLTRADLERIPAHLHRAAGLTGWYEAIPGVPELPAASEDAAEPETAVHVPPAVAAAAARQGRRGAGLATKDPNVAAAVVAAPTDETADKE
jgi:hypothetical protein